MVDGSNFSGGHGICTTSSLTQEDMPLPWLARKSCVVSKKGYIILSAYEELLFSTKEGENNVEQKRGK